MTARPSAAPSVLFVHNNFPAQFGELGLWLARRGWKVSFATEAEKAVSDSIRILKYAPHREPVPQVHPYAQPMERAALYAQAFARTALAARREGFRPDLIVAHSGWGPGLCAQDVFPEAAYVAYCEWWYRYPGVDVAYLVEAGLHPPSSAPDAPMIERMRNAPIAMDVASAAASICPTKYQASQFPPTLAPLLTIEHDGVDVDAHSPDPAMRESDLGGLLPPGARVVTYATRGMEPHRGFPQFMDALPRILAEDPRAVAVIAGENRVAYGGGSLRKTDWKAEALARHAFDPKRVLFVGRLSRQDYIRLLRRSDAHVYLTAPFVLSWSMLEAMSVGCALVLSDTDPVLEFADDACARMVDMRAPDAIATAVLETLADPDGNVARRAEARRRIVTAIPREAAYARKRDLFLKLIGRAG